MAAERYGVVWNGRRYDRDRPGAGDRANQAIKHAASAISAAAATALAAIPQLGFIHEDSGQAFVLDIADLYRHDVTLDIAFGAVKDAPSLDPIERVVCRRAAKLIRQRGVIPSMIGRIKRFFDIDDDAATSNAVAI